MRLRLYHHPDGTRIAYREAGTGPRLALFHAGGLSHREFEPLAEHLTHRFRLVLPDLPLHGDSEDHPRHPYTLEWLADVIAGFCRDTLGSRPLVGGHEAGAQVLLHAITSDLLAPARLVLMPNRLHAAPPRAGMRAWKALARAGAVPGLDRATAYGAALAARTPAGAQKLTARHDSDAQDLVRHAFADVAGNANRARAWARLARSWPIAADTALRDAYPRITAPTLLLWADEDRWHPVSVAEEAMRLLPDAQLRILPRTGFLLTYDDPVGVARELVSFCG
jgi:pimeloyl-ACP methyl ester carboxylesterase